jgi:hypothetical protein
MKLCRFLDDYLMAKLPTFAIRPRSSLSGFTFNSYTAQNILFRCPDQHQHTSLMIFVNFVHRRKSCRQSCSPSLLSAEISLP